MLTQARLRFASIALFGFAAVLNGQVDTGTIVGVVHDSSGAVIPGATVAVHNEGTSFSQTTTTGPDGNYAFPALKIGKYTVSAEHTGFKKEVRSISNLTFSNNCLSISICRLEM